MSWKENLISSTPNIQLQPPPLIKQVQATHTLVAIPSTKLGSFRSAGKVGLYLAVNSANRSHCAFISCIYGLSVKAK